MSVRQHRGLPRLLLVIDAISNSGQQELLLSRFETAWSSCDRQSRLVSHHNHYSTLRLWMGSDSEQFRSPSRKHLARNVLRYAFWYRLSNAY